jgi:CheY-like chemotaxis protein
MRKVNNALLVDGDPMSNMVNEEVMHTSKFAHKVGSYMDAEEALDYLRGLVEFDITNFPNVLFLDINLPEMNGWEFLEQMNKFPKFILSRCKVFMLTSSTEQKDIEKSKPYKIVHDFVSKPLTVDKIKTLFFRKMILLIILYK